jgi:hypothetical protein
MDPNKEEESALDSLEQKLYDPKGKIDNLSFHHVRDRTEKELPTSWTEDTPIIRAAEDHSGLSFGTKFLIGAFILLLLVLSFAAWRVLSSRNVVSEKNIEMTLDIVQYIEGGEETPLILTINNKNEVELQEATLTLMYKQGTGTQDEEEKVQERRDLGTISAGDFKRQDFNVILYGSEAESRDITARLEYKVPGSNAKFSKVSVSQVVLKSPPISVRIEGPNILSAGQTGTFIVSVQNNTATTTRPTLLSMTLPTNFVLEEANPRSSSRGTLWQIKALEPGEIATVTLTGSVSGSQGETATMRGVIGSIGGSLTEVGVVYSSYIYDVKLRTSPLLLTLSLTTDRGTSENLRYADRSYLAIKYKNTSAEPLQDASIVLTVGGTAALLKDVTTDFGYYDSSKGTITWDKAHAAELATLAPNEEGTLFVNIPIVTKGTNSPKLTLTAVGKATLSETDDVVATISKSYVVQGSASIQARTQYKNSPFQNTGPIPPQPNVDTTYTLHLTVSAQNALERAYVSFVLPAYVSWKNVGDVSRVSYDAKTRTVTWNIGTLGAGKTTSVDIGVTVRPSQVHVNSSPSITGGIILDADEVESRAHIKTTIPGLTTRLDNEAWPGNPSIVVDP